MTDLLEKWNNADHDDWTADMGLAPRASDLDTVEDLIESGCTDIVEGTRAWLRSLGVSTGAGQ